MTGKTVPRDADPWTLTLLTTLSRRIKAVKTYRKENGKTVVDGYGKSKRFRHREIRIDPKGNWLRALAPAEQSFVVLGAVKDKSEEIIFRRTQDREDGRADLKDARRMLMPLDIDHLDIDLSTVCDIHDGTRIAKEVLSRLGIPGTRCVCHFTNSHGFDDKYRVRLWIELEEPATAEQMRQWAEAKWEPDNFGVDVLDAKGKKVRKRIVDLSVLQPQQPVYTGDPILEDGIRSPVKNRVFPVKGHPLALGSLPRNTKRKKAAGEEEDPNIKRLRDAGLYIEQQSPGHHFVDCPWEDEHSGEARKDDTLYHEPNYGGHKHPTFKCHHETHKDRTWDDVEAWIDEQGGDDDQGKPDPNWVYVHRKECFWDARDGALITRAQYDTTHASKGKGKASDRFLAMTRSCKADDLVFDPGRGRFFQRGKVSVLNTYVDLRTAPDASIDVTPWTEHLKWLIPSATDREHVSDWLAWCYQHPEAKITWGVILYSAAFGVGKTTVFNALAECIGGERYVSEPTQAELEDKFNDWAFGKLLVKIEELMSGDKLHVAEKLKPVVSNPTLSIRRMHQTGFVVPNMANVCASTNHMTALPIARGDRRWMLVQCREEEDVEVRKAHMRAFHRWLEEVGHGAIARWLSERDVSRFVPTGEAPSTSLKTLVSRATMTDFDLAVELCDVFDQEDWVSGVMIEEHLRKNLSEQAVVKLSKQHGLIAEKRKWKNPSKVDIGLPDRWLLSGRKTSFWLPTGKPLPYRAMHSKKPAERQRVHENKLAKAVFGEASSDE